MAELKIFTGNAHRVLASRVTDRLRIELGDAEVSRFSDGEVSVEIQDNVRGKDVFIIQPTCAPTNDNLMELIVMADCLHRASATRITAVIPYFGYARQVPEQWTAFVAQGLDKSPVVSQLVQLG